jgi:putative DNA primase/helicase
VTDLFVAPPSHPMPNARRFVDERYAHDGDVILLHTNGAFYAWTGSLWTEVDADDMRSQLYDRFEHALWLKTTSEGPKAVDFEPNRRSVGYLVEALGAVTQHPPLQAPVWVDTDGWTPAIELVACGNGLLHVPTRTLYAHTPRFFNTHCVPFDYDPDAPTPQLWLNFLKELWNGDRESIDCVQELFGYLVSGDTRQQKIFLLNGPKRSGKGTIARVATRLIGEQHVANPTLASLSSNFGLQPLVNASVAFIGDARLPKDGTSIIAERLLSISGEDALTVDRKYRDAWTGKLPTRIVMLTNELPRITDVSGALASRFILLTLTQSFYGKEDTELSEKLYGELPGIFNWSLEGLERLHHRGRFVQPTSSREAIRELEDIASPVAAFVRDRCVIGAQHEIDVDTLWHAWKVWCDDQGWERTGTRQIFGRDLRAALPGLRKIQPRGKDGARYRAYQGIALRPQRNRGPL